MVERAGFKSEMTDLHAAIGLRRLADVEANLVVRNRLWKAYDDGFVGSRVVTPSDVQGGDRHARHLYTIMVDETSTGIGRNELAFELKKKGIVVGFHYKDPLCGQPYYQRRLGWKRDDCPLATAVCDRTMTLPLSPWMTEEHVAEVVSSIRGIIG